MPPPAPVTIATSPSSRSVASIIPSSVPSALDMAMPVEVVRECCRRIEPRPVTGIGLQPLDQKTRPAARRGNTDVRLCIIVHQREGEFRKSGLQQIAPLADRPAPAGRHDIDRLRL